MKTPPGIYMHAETEARYRVLGVASDATNGPEEGSPYVVYISLVTGRMHVRKETEFHEDIRIDDSDGSFRHARRFRIVQST